MKLKCLPSDSGGEYTAERMTDFFLDHGIAQKFTCCYALRQNETEEKMNRTILETIRAMLKQKHAPKEFWAYAVVTTVFIRNRVSCHPIADSRTP